MLEADENMTGGKTGYDNFRQETEKPGNKEEEIHQQYQ